MSPESLERLAAAHGIGLKWSDVFGRDYEVPERSLRALLGAMGIAAGSDGEVEASLRDLERRPWEQALPSVLVCPAGASAATTTLRLRVDLESAVYELLLEREDGSRERRSFTPSQLERAGTAEIAGVHYGAWKLDLPKAPLGYHRVTLLRDGARIARQTLIVTPDRCYSPQAVRGAGRVWGPALQLYAVRSRRNWGIGDFTDLHAALELWVSRGAGVLGVNPLHALFPHDPSHTSPYSPSSRLFLNALYLDPDRIDDLRESDEARALRASSEIRERLEALRSAELVDYAGVAEVKYRFFELAYAGFRTRQLASNSERAQAFRRFQQAGGRALELHATFEALQEHLHRADRGIWGWPKWPANLREPDSPEVARFAAEHRDRVEFYQYLQWLADLQLGAVGERALSLGAGVGLYGDLAVSMDRAGAEGWTHQGSLACDASVGAPPDEVNVAGQNWGLPPLIPARLQASAYAPFIALLRATMRHNGALRIDHVMGLERLYWIPAGAQSSEGAYVSYPLDDLLGIVALESHRNSCLVVGEDLGTVSDAMRSALQRFGILSYRLLYFERRWDGEFKSPGEYPAEALTAITTHDLATVAGFWERRDLQVREQLQQFPSDEVARQQFAERTQARQRLLRALERENLLPPGVGPDPASTPEMTPALALALHEYVARSPAKLLVIQPEDILGMRDQVNLPGTTGEIYPNWRRKLTLDIEDFAADERFRALTDAIARIRPVGRTQRRAAVIPRATYRVQLNGSFTFRDAAAIVPYLAALGVSHLYCSPYFRARPGSTHGYDVVDHGVLNPEIGSYEDFEHLASVLASHGMGQVLDIVPNHVGIMGADNPWWMDVLENGIGSAYAPFFDIDWHPPNPALAGKVLAAALGDQYGRVLERGELRLVFEHDSGSFAVFYHQHRFPIDPAHYPALIASALDSPAGESLDERSRDALQSLAADFARLPDRDRLTAIQSGERHRDKEICKRRLAVLCSRVSAVVAALEAGAASYAGRSGASSSFDALHALLEKQAYRLAYWRVASDDINYRRFFDVNDLAALRMEHEAAFGATHALALDLVAEGKVDGLRVDHPDGLYDPAQYFRRLQDRARTLTGASDPLPMYLVIEKITAPFEPLPRHWPVHGTTGYRFANVVNGLFVDAAAKSRLMRTYRSFIGEALDWDDVAYESKRFMVGTSLAAELNVLANQLVRIARADRNTRDFTFASLRQALAEVIACFPVYRTYIATQVSAEDRRYVDWAIGVAKRRGAGIDTALFDFIRAVLLGDGLADDPDLRERARAFAMKLQQVTSPVTAKGVEDTGLYRFNPLSSLNEVGGEPESFGTSVRAFHADARRRARHWPNEMLATSTHDTKRSEDVRLRIDVLSEMPAEWRHALERWRRMNRARKREVDGRPAPRANDEYLFYQTLLGTLPSGRGGPAGSAGDASADEHYRSRIEAYLIKAAREAKRRTSWSNVNEAYEDAIRHFVAGALERRDGNLFLAEAEALAARAAYFGALNGLSQTLIKLTCPGMPDLYQGNETLDYSLVDPDNRRTVDYGTRRRMLAELQSLPQESFPEAASALARSPTDGRAKLFVTWKALELRRCCETLFSRGEYLPLKASGTHAAHLCAFARRWGDQTAIVIAPRLYARLTGAQAPAGAGADRAPLGEDIWADTAVDLPAGIGDPAPRNLFDARTLRIAEHEGIRRIVVADALAHFPVALFA